MEKCCLFKLLHRLFSIRSQFVGLDDKIWWASDGGEAESPVEESSDRSGRFFIVSI